MKIVVIGGSGLIGKKLVKLLGERGHKVVAASPSTGVNTVTGEGLAEALTGARAVVDVANAPSWEDKAVLEFFETSGRNLLAAEAAAGVGHHVALSVVGTERLLASGYFRAKMAQEGLIKASKVPYTIVRATQFFEFVGGIAQFSWAASPSSRPRGKRCVCPPPSCIPSRRTTAPPSWRTSRWGSRSTEWSRWRAPSRSAWTSSPEGT